MTEQPIYKSLKVTLAIWQAITRIKAQTGEPHTRLIERLIRAEEDRLKIVSNTERNTNTGDTGDTGGNIPH